MSTKYDRDWAVAKYGELVGNARWAAGWRVEDRSDGLYWVPSAEPATTVHEIARDACGDNHHPSHPVPGQSRFDDPKLCDHCADLARQIEDLMTQARHGERRRCRYWFAHMVSRMRLSEEDAEHLSVLDSKLKSGAEAPDE
jgi:hypothetical protein